MTTKNVYRTRDQSGSWHGDMPCVLCYCLVLCSVLARSVLGGLGPRCSSAGASSRFWFWSSNPKTQDARRRRSPHCLLPSAWHQRACGREEGGAPPSAAAGGWFAAKQRSGGGPGADWFAAKQRAPLPWGCRGQAPEGPPAAHMPMDPAARARISSSGRHPRRG